MSTNGAGVTGKVQLPILIANNLSAVGSSTSRGLPVVSSEGARQQLAVPAVDPCIRASSQSAAPAAFAGAFLGCLITLHLSAFGVVPEIASALVTTLLGGQLLISRSTIQLAREFVPAVYGGAFGGMTSVLWLSGIGSDHPMVLAGALFISLSIVCGLAFSAVAVFDAYSGRRFTNGYGGRSGAIATVACVFFVQLAALCGADDRLFHAARADLADVNLGSLAPIIAACLTGTTVSLLVLRRERVAAADLADKTFVASAIALIGLIVVHRISPTDARLLDAYYAGCFLGMSSRERLKGWIETVLGALVLASLIIQVRIFLPGIGGGLGLAAFVTVAVLVTLKQFTRFVLPINRSENMATQLSTVRSGAGHSVANPQFGRRGSTWSEISRRPAAAIASLAVAAAVIGGLVWPTQFVSKKSISVATAPVSVVDEVTPDPVAPQAEVRSVAIDAATPLGTAGAAEASPGSTASSQNTSSENPSEISADSPAGLRLSSAAVDEQAAGSEGPKTAPPVTSEVIAAREPALGETQKAEDDATDAALFREFLQWRAARVSGVAPTAREKAANSHHRLRPPAAIPTPAAINSQSRSTHPSSAAQATPTTSPAVRPRRPHLSNTQTHATTEQMAPASATASTPSL
jgi:hypothetical protein